MLAKSTGELPHSRQQTYNMKKHQQSQDPLYSLIIDIQTLDSSEEINLSVS